MRTTITLDSDVAERLQELMRERHLTFKEAVNSTLRKGFASGVAARPYVMEPRRLGLKPGIDGDRIAHFADEMADRGYLSETEADE